MSQSDVFQWLLNKRESGDLSYFLPKEIERGLRDQGLGSRNDRVRGDCFRLWQHGNGCLEMFDQDQKGIDNWHKAFRVRGEYCRVKK